MSTTTTHAGTRLRRVATSQGEVELPIRYWDVSTAVALFTVSAQPARELVAPIGVEPIPLGGQRALAAMVFYEYRHTSVGIYNEVGLTVAGVPPGTPGWRLATDPLRAVRRRNLGWAVLDLPVTTERANAAGREIWGYPKFVTDIPIRFTPQSFHGQVRDPSGDEAIVTLEGTMGSGLPGPRIDLVTYTTHEDTTWRTVVDVRGRFRVHRGSGLRLDVGASTHPMAQRLRTLGLVNARPAAVLITHDWRSLLHGGAPLQ